MCGILGSVNKPFGTDLLDLLYHRGPDDSGMTVSSFSSHLLTLAHRRLSILDLSEAGHQPMWTHEPNCGIVFNGEIYNHLELRDQIPCVRYRGHSDTETILHYLAHNGVHSIDRFNGIFALAFIDPAKQKLFLARDAFGVKPLYYWTDDRSFVFSSEIRAIQQLVGDTLEPGNLAELLRLRYLPAPDTLFKNIRKVRPGHVLEVDFRTRRLSVCEYPFIGRVKCEAPVRTREDAIEQYGTLLHQAVKRQLLSDVEVGIFLSGGIDSALVATIAQKCSSGKTKAFTVGFSCPDESDELADAQESARIIGLDHHEVRMDFPDFLDILPRVSAIVEEPLATTSMVPMFYVSSLASNQVKVVLSGQGADEALGGYRRYKAEILRSLWPAFALPFLAMSARSMGSFRGLDAIGQPDDVRRFEAIYSVFNQAQIARLIGYDASRATERIRYFFDLLECSTQRRSVERMMSIDLRMNLADDLLLYTDKITMHHSIECRVPLLDLDLIRFVESLPSAYRTGVFRSKIVHKQFARRILPASIVNRKKKGFKSPTGRWFRANTSIRDILLDPTSKFCSHFNRGEVKHILDQHAAGMDRERQIFLLLSIFYWMEGASQPARNLAPNVMSLHA